ncbi:MAG: NifU family protein [Flavobacteriales bacterium]|nr:NifU family protein [Flavobacteriales bacterium]NNK80866.1 NifU family protein [Flavobacteriales bacterium]
MSKEEKIELIQDALRGLRPFLEKDNGDITFVDLTEDYKVHVELHGSCKSCSMSMMTLKAGVEERIKDVLPEIKEVVAVQP